MNFYDRVYVNIANTGSGSPITVGANVAGYRTFSSAGVVNGANVAYTIIDGTNFEVGFGVFTSSSNSITRNVITSSNNDSSIDLTGTAALFITESAGQIIDIKNGQVGAFDKANTACTSADVAQTTGVAAFNQANTGVTNAATAQTSALAAFNQANTATTNATAGLNRASDAFAQANTGVTNADTALSTGQGAFTLANTVSTRASSAYSQANTGVTNAATALSTGQAAFSQANTGVTNAATALSTGQGAFAQANSALPSSSYTASDVLTKIKTVDGSGSGLDADTVDGIQGSTITSAFAQANTGVTNAAAAQTTASAAYGQANTGVTNAATALSTGQGAFAKANSAYSPTNVPDFTDIGVTPTTLSGYGITDALPLTGGTLTGDLTSNGGSLTLNAPAGNNASLLLRRAAAGTVAGISSYVGSLPRWSFQLGNGTAESGGNAGSNFALYTYADDGTFIGTAFSITRADMHANFGGNLYEQGQRVYSPNNPPDFTDIGVTPTTLSGYGITDALNLSGGTITGVLNITGEVQTTAVNSYRHVYGNYGAFWRIDSSNLYLMLTNSGDQYGNYNSLRPFYVSLASGAVTIGDGLNVSGGTLSEAGQRVYSPNNPPAFSGIASKPTTLSGYGITDAVSSSTYTASDVLTKIKTVDGSGSGLDADTLDTHNSSYFYSSANQPFIPTSSTLPVGWSGTMFYAYGSTLADGATLAGSGLRAGNGSGGSQTGTWKNISGGFVAANSSGLFLRIA